MKLLSKAEVRRHPGVYRICTNGRPDYKSEALLVTKDHQLRHIRVEARKVDSIGSGDYLETSACGWTFKRCEAPFKDPAFLGFKAHSKRTLLCLTCRR